MQYRNSGCAQDVRRCIGRCTEAQKGAQGSAQVHRKVRRCTEAQKGAQVHRRQAAAVSFQPGPETVNPQNQQKVGDVGTYKKIF